MRLRIEISPATGRWICQPWPQSLEEFHEVIDLVSRNYTWALCEVEFCEMIFRIALDCGLTVVKGVRNTVIADHEWQPLWLLRLASIETVAEVTK